MFKATIRLFSFGPFIVSVEDAQGLYPIDLAGLYSLHPLLVARVQPSSQTLTIDHRTCTFTLTASLLHSSERPVP